jgi:dipeptide transport system permease protein
MTDEAIAVEVYDARRTGRIALVAEFWSYFRENRGAVAGLVFFVTICLVAVFADFVAPHGATVQYRDALLQPPVWQAGGDWRFILGTDPVGRDMLSRLIHGSRYSLFIGLVVVSLSLAVGVLHRPDRGLLRRLSRHLHHAGHGHRAGLPEPAAGAGHRRHPRAQPDQRHDRHRHRPAALFRPPDPGLGDEREDARIRDRRPKVAGVGRLRLMFSTILPNCMAPLIVQAALSFSTAILDAAALGFLGMGAQPPTPEWGTMLAEAREFILRAWWVVTFPGLAILLTVLAINLMGDGLRDALDPRLRRS